MMPHIRERLVVLLSCLQLFQRVGGSSSFHLPLLRRHGRFTRHETANLTLLSDVLEKAEARYASTCRDVENNRLVRKWRSKDDMLDDDNILSRMDSSGPWFAAIQVGEPPQTLEFDLDMLSPDFYTVMTTSGKGSRYDTFISKTHGHSDERIHTLCRNPTEVFHLDISSSPPKLVLPICSPMKSSRHTLSSSGSIIGLVPDGSLTRLPRSNILEQLKNDKIISDGLWSITLPDIETGILSLGGTIARDMERAKIQGELELQRLGDPAATDEWIGREVDKKLSLSLPDTLPTEAHFKWTNIQGAAGWWTALMAGVWVNGAKVLKNQPILFDIQCPFILAPPAAASRIYESIGSAIRLPPPQDRFFAFPCLNQVNVAFEIGGWNFPSMSGEGTRTDALHGPAGGRFSLGKMGNGTGYCIGRIVETTMGLRREWDPSGLHDTWVLGEPFFRGLGVVFDSENGRVGVRSY